MNEYIGCRNCESPDCKGCNLKNLETMLNNGKFDCLMNENRCINPSADVVPVRKGRWESDGLSSLKCSDCGYLDDMKMYHRYCPDCGCFMR